jgi:ankyrin repeat protein
VDLGADVKAKDKYGETVMHLAARGGNKAIVRLLVDKGADVIAKNNVGETVLQR